MKIDIRGLKKIICDESGISLSQIESKSKSRIIVIAKTIFVVLAKEITLNDEVVRREVNMSLQAKNLAIRRYLNLIRYDHTFKYTVERIKERIQDVQNIG